LFKNNDIKKNFVFYQKNTMFRIIYPVAKATAKRYGEVYTHVVSIIWNAGKT